MSGIERLLARASLPAGRWSTGRRRLEIHPGRPAMHVHGMTRRRLLAMAAPAVLHAAPARVTVPIHRILDGRAKNPPERVQHFWPRLWSEAAQDYRQGGIDFDITDGPGEVRHSPADNPVFVGLRGRAINLVVTDVLPIYWDGGRALAGVSTIHD